MAKQFFIPLWKQAPFLRLVIALVTGILLQAWLDAGVMMPAIMLCVACIFLFIFNISKVDLRYRFRKIAGTVILCCTMAAGMLLTRLQDSRRHAQWYGNYEIGNNTGFLVRILESPVEKPASFKAEAELLYLINGQAQQKVEGKLLIYLAKNDNSRRIGFGDKVLFRKSLQAIKNSGNPGAFDFKAYAARQQIFHSVYLAAGDFQLLEKNDPRRWSSLIHQLETGTLSLLRKYLDSSRNIIGIGEALLIGYKIDLDKDLVQAYSNTGVVHIIAISGLHLGLIYAMLVWIFEKIPFVRKSRLIKVSLILCFLWIFSLVTGASASVLRSAVMFTCILIGKNYFRTASMYSSLAASAFFLLCYNPYFLWDVGFQLSYLAVIGIVWLQKPLYRLLSFRNKWLDKLWSMCSVTLAAQAITFPICIYYFHQFPNLFLFANLIAVPLSTLVLFAEIILLGLAWLPPLAKLIGLLCSRMIDGMNLVIRYINECSFSTTDCLFATPLSTGCLYLLVVTLACALVDRSKNWLRLSFPAYLLLCGVTAWNEVAARSQCRLVIYNIPRTRAVDFISGTSHVLIADSAIRANQGLYNFHLKPAHIAMQLDAAAATLPGLRKMGHCIELYGKSILMIDSITSFMPSNNKIPVDILLISKNPRLKMADLAAAVQPSIIIFDASNTLWKIEKWKKECDRLALRCHSIPESGAYIFDIH